MEVEVARKMGLTLSEWLEKSEDDRDWLLALEAVEREENAKKCPVCGGDASECQDPGNKRAYEVTNNKCFRQAAVLQAATGYSNDKYAGAIAPKVKYHPEWVRPKK